MALLPSGDLSGLPRLRGFLRSTHALIALLSALCPVFAIVGGADVVVVRGSFALFALLVLVVLGRYLWKGPESDRQQAIISISATHTELSHVDLSQLLKPELRPLLHLLGSLRQPLPPPAGVIEGSVSDPASLVEISADKAKQIADQDNAQLVEAVTMLLEKGSPAATESATPPPTPDDGAA